MKVKARQMLFNRDPNRPQEVRYGLVDTKGRTWERYSDRKSGDWEEIELPDEPRPKRRSKRRRRP